MKICMGRGLERARRSEEKLEKGVKGVGIKTNKHHSYLHTTLHVCSPIGSYPSRFLSLSPLSRSAHKYDDIHSVIAFVSLVGRSPFMSASLSVRADEEFERQEECLGQCFFRLSFV